MKIFEDWKSSYEILPRYFDAMKVSNLSTITATCYDLYAYRMVWFRRVFWVFGPSIAGFQYCQPLLCINGIYLYEKFKCCLLIAIRVDAEGGLYPLIFAVVEVKAEASWQWFIWFIYHLILSVHHDKSTFIFDRVKGIPNVLRAGCQTTHNHHYCLWHIISVLGLWRCMFQIESSISSGQHSISLMLSTNWLGQID